MSVNSLRSPADQLQLTPVHEPPSLSDNWTKDRRRVSVASHSPRAVRFVPQLGTLKWTADGTALEHDGMSQSASGGSGGEIDVMVMTSDVDYVNGL
jgi:hypothetical protein